MKIDKPMLIGSLIGAVISIIGCQIWANKNN